MDQNYIMNLKLTLTIKTLEATGMLPRPEELQPILDWLTKAPTIVPATSIISAN